MTGKWLLPFLLAHFTLIIHAQDFKTSEIIQDRLEFLTNDEDAETQDYSELIDDLNNLLIRGVDINAEAYLLLDIGLINRKQFKAIQKHIELNGPIELTYELQTIDGFGSADVKRIQPFIKRKELMSEAPMGREKKSTTLILRTQRIIETEKGYTAENGYLGNPFKLFVRYQSALSKSSNLGLLMEKDAGEPWFNPNQRKGFDFYSFNLVKRLKGKDDKVILGDFHLNLGQGLLSWSGAGRRKSAEVLQIKGFGKALKAANSSNETSYFRGLAIEKRLSKASEVLLFYSLKFADASLNDDYSEITSLPVSGLHRTEKELQKKHKAIKEDVGFEWRKKFRRHQLDFRTIGSDIRINTAKPYGVPISSEVFDSGNWASSFTIDLGYDFADFFSEFATDFQSKHSAVFGVISTVNSFVSWSLLNRHIQSGNLNSNSKSFAEGRGNLEESGMYFGVEIHPNSWSELSVYSDYFHLKSTESDAKMPYTGIDRLLQFKMRPTKKLEILFRVQGKKKEKLSPSTKESYDIQLSESTRQYRFELKYQLSERFALKWRYNVKTYDLETLDEEVGQLFFQDILYRSEGNRTSISCRYALTNTESFNTRMYAYENDLLYAFSIPAYYGKSSRYYLMLSKKLWRNVQFWLRYSRTTFFDRLNLGSGLTEINGNTKSDIKFQLRLNF